MFALELFFLNPRALFFLQSIVDVVYCCVHVSSSSSTMAISIGRPRGSMRYLFVTALLFIPRHVVLPLLHCFVVNCCVYACYRLFARPNHYLQTASDGLDAVNAVAFGAAAMDGLGFLETVARGVGERSCDGWKCRFGCVGK